MRMIARRYIANRKISTMAADRRFEIASNVQAGLALARARRHRSLSSDINMSHRKAARDRQARNP
ncbi:hypothetical protein TM239_30090 [Bradyrhizobium sp. TM239]|nr:hypothetical protein TM233_59710 [Bradyrhizobium sp. TM233]GMP01930.1 hypothetical protein TM239_30090 [Bradyrhizobium sp. TM239]